MTTFRDICHFIAIDTRGEQDYHPLRFDDTDNGNISYTGTDGVTLWFREWALATPPTQNEIDNSELVISQTGQVADPGDDPDEIAQNERLDAIDSALTQRRPWTFAEAPGLVIADDTSNTWAISEGYAWFWNETTQRHTRIFVPEQSGFPFPPELSSGTLGRTYVYLSEGGGLPLIATEEAAPTEHNQGNRICLGVMSTLDGSTFNSVVPFLVDRDPVTRSLLTERYPVKNLSGIRFFPPPDSSTGRRLEHNSGIIVAAGRNWHPNPNNPHCVDVVGGIYDVNFIDQTGNTRLGAVVLQFDRLDDGAGGFVTQTSGAGISRLFMSATGTIVQLAPQIWYPDIATATDAEGGENWVRPDLLDGFVHIATLIHRYDTNGALLDNEAYLRIINHG
jgi:hypothetical protein